MAKPSLFDKLDQWLFDAIYSRNLVYNACWEDPAIDRKALALGPEDTLLAISSAGCNVLDYALLGPKHIFAVDANPRQIALLELKMAGIRTLAFDDFFAIFGSGHHPEFRKIYESSLRAQLSPFAQTWWDKHWNWFAGKHGSFYFTVCPASSRAACAPISGCGRVWRIRSMRCSTRNHSPSNRKSTTSASRRNCGTALSTGSSRASSS